MITDELKNRLDYFQQKEIERSFEEIKEALGVSISKDINNRFGDHRGGATLTEMEKEKIEKVKKALKFLSTILID